MRILRLLVVLGAVSWGQTDQERQLLDRSLNAPLLFTPAGQADWSQAVPTWPQPDGPMSEVTAPKLSVSSVRWLNPEIVVVEGAWVQFGSMIVVRRVPLLLVLKRDAGQWKVDLVRMLP